MEAVKFKAWYGDIWKMAELSRVYGTGGSINVHLYVDGYYQGDFFKRQDKWVFPRELTSDEAYILTDMIEKYLMD